MKKIKVIMTAIILSLSLISCGKSEEVKNVESLIESIGTVTRETESKIIEAEKEYSNLLEDDKSKVDNYDDLQNARDEYNNIGKDFSEETKYCARAIITIKNCLKDPNSIEVHKVDFNDGEHKYAQIDYSAKNSYGGLSRSTYIVTNDEDVIISGKPDDETYLYFIDNTERTVSLDSKIEINYDDVMFLVERYSNTKDKEYLGLDAQTIEESQAKIEIINTKIARRELLKDTHDSFMEDQFEILEVFNDAMTNVAYNNYNKAENELDKALVLIEELENKDISDVSLELEEAKNKYTETMKLCCDELPKFISAMKNYDVAELEKHKKSMTEYLFQASDAAIEFVTIYDELVKEVN